MGPQRRRISPLRRFARRCRCLYNNAGFARLSAPTSLLSSLGANTFLLSVSTASHSPLTESWFCLYVLTRLHSDGPRHLLTPHGGNDSDLLCSERPHRGLCSWCACAAFALDVRQQKLHHENQRAAHGAHCSDVPDLPHDSATDRLPAIAIRLDSGRYLQGQRLARLGAIAESRRCPSREWRC